MQSYFIVAEDLVWICMRLHKTVIECSDLYAATELQTRTNKRIFYFPVRSIG